MTTNFLVALVILCVSSASGLHLEPICSSSSFSYEGIQVNAFHRVPQFVYFEPLPYFLIDRSIDCDLDQFRNESNHLIALKARNR